MLSKDQAASTLAQAHYRIERSIRHIFRVRNASTESHRDDPIRLLEVNDATIPCGILPVYFGPFESSGLNFPSVIVDVTPDEFTKLQQHALSLPDGWELGEELPRSESE